MRCLAFYVTVLALPFAAHAGPVFTVSDQGGNMDAEATAAWFLGFDQGHDTQEIPQSGPFSGSVNAVASETPIAAASASARVDYTITDTSLGVSGWAGVEASSSPYEIDPGWQQWGDGFSQSPNKVWVRFAVHKPATFRFSTHLEAYGMNVIGPEGYASASATLRFFRPDGSLNRILAERTLSSSGKADVLESGTLAPESMEQGFYEYRVWWSATASADQVVPAPSASASVNSLLEVFTCQNPVADLATAHQDPRPYNVNELDSALRTAVGDFESLVKSSGGWFDPTSGYRPPEYQAHLYEVAGKAQELANIRGGGILADTNGRGGISRLFLSDDPSVCALQADLDGIIDAVNLELSVHGLRPPASGPRGVNPPGRSRHEEGLAADVTIGGLSQADITRLAEDAGLWQPIPSEPWHFELKGTPPKLQGAIKVESPVNLLVEDPLGRRIGFDPLTGQVVNEIGQDAEYSGAGTEPQFILVPLGEVLLGDYRIKGVGTGDGPYTISIQTWTEDSLGEPLIDQVIATGTAATGMPIDPVVTPLFIIPEPCSLVLLAAGALTLLACGWRRVRANGGVCWPPRGVEL